jgi:hypothetical protein
MMFRSTVLATLAATAAAKSILPESDIAANSKLGKKIMQKARALEDNGDQDNSWMTNYSIKYMGCSSLMQVNAEGGGDGDGEPMLYTQNLVKFALCPSDVECSKCTTGDAQYVVNMMDFVQAYSEMKTQEQESKCEYIAENCYCDNANDDQVCENQCYADAGMNECIEYEDEDGEEFEIERYLECDAMEGADGDNNNNNNGNNYYYNSGANDNGVDMYRQYYIGPSCSEKDGMSINLSVFLDAGCSSKASSGVYEAFNYGKSLPYESQSIVSHDECLSCIQADDENDNNNGNNNNNNYNNNNNNNNYQNQDVELSELCDESYQASAKCEAGLTAGNYFYPDTTGCQYINYVLPNLEKATRKISRNSTHSGSGGAATAFAVIFFLSSCVLGAYSFFLYRKIHRAKVNLSHSDAMTMA